MKQFNISDSARYEKALRKAREIRAFYINLLAYCVVIPTLVYINLTYNPEYYWFLFSMLGWGTGLLLHAVAAFDYNPLLGKKWEEKKLAELIEKEREKQSAYQKIKKL